MRLDPVWSEVIVHPVLYRCEVVHYKLDGSDQIRFSVPIRPHNDAGAAAGDFEHGFLLIGCKIFDFHFQQARLVES